MKANEQLVRAAAEGQCARVRRLLREGARVDLVWQRRTAVDHAVFHGHTKVVRVLLAAGADPNQEIGEYRETLPLRCAAARGRSRIVHALLVAGARPDGRLGEAQYTALSVAAAEGHTKIVEELLAHGAEPDGLGDIHSHPLGGAAYGGQPDIVRLLLEHGALATPAALDAVLKGRAAAERQAHEGVRTATQLAEPATRYGAITALLTHAMTQQRPT